MLYILESMFYVLFYIYNYIYIYIFMKNENVFIVTRSLTPVDDLQTTNCLLTKELVKTNCQTTN